MCQMKLCHLVIMLSQGTVDDLQKSQVPDDLQTCFWVIGDGNPRYQNIKAIAGALFYLPELKVGTCCRRQQALRTENWRNGAGYDTKPPLWGLALIVLELDIHVANGGKSPIFLPSCDACELQQWQA